MTEAKKPAARKPAARKAAVNPELSLAAQQLKAFTGVNGKAQAIAFFKNSMPRLVTSYDHGDEAFSLIKKWNDLKSIPGDKELGLDDLAEILPDLKRFVDLTYGENAREVIATHFEGNLWTFFQEVN